MGDIGTPRRRYEVLPDEPVRAPEPAPAPSTPAPPTPTAPPVPHREASR